MPVDFTAWTDAQLEVGAKYAKTSSDIEAIAAEQMRRTGQDDGSKARVAAFIEAAR